MKIFDIFGAALTFVSRNGENETIVSGTKIVTYVNQLVMLSFLTEGGVGWEVYFDREDKNVC